MAGRRLTAYYGGSGMWSALSDDRTRSYAIRTGRGGAITSITNRRGDPVRVDGATATEISRAMRRSRAEQEAAARGCSRDS